MIQGLWRSTYPFVSFTFQLIKWFRNFREFCLIQKEKFARHALIDGVADVRGLTVGRQSELFRAFSMHYNKANDLQVTDTTHYNYLMADVSLS